jgi:hypothetical protein
MTVDDEWQQQQQSSSAAGVRGLFNGFLVHRPAIDIAAGTGGVIKEAKTGKN